MAKYVNVPVNSGASKRRKRALSSADLSWNLTGLDEFTLYVIRVLAYTIGSSAYSPAVEIRTAEDGIKSGDRMEKGNKHRNSGIAITTRTVKTIGIKKIQPIRIREKLE